MDTPPLGLTTKVHFLRVVDADTIEIQLKRNFKVRIKDLLCEEKNKPAGIIAKEFAIGTFKENEILTLHIPHQIDNEKLLNLVSFDRVIGNIWMEDGRNYADIIVNSGNGRYLNEGEKGHMGI